MEGLQGEADLDGDGRITVDELYDYAYERVKRATPNQTPLKISNKQQGQVILRQNIPIEDIRPVPLPDDLLDAMSSYLPKIREGAVYQLVELINGRNLGLARSARLALEKIVEEDDSRHISQMAAQLLQSISEAIEKPEKEQKAKEAEELVRKQEQARREEEEVARTKSETTLKPSQQIVNDNQAKASTAIKIISPAPKTGPDRSTWGDTEYCLIPAGKFVMGSNQSYTDKALQILKNTGNESPQHTVDIPYDYWIARFPVTNEQYSTFVRAVRKKHPVKQWEIKRSNPVVNVSWMDTHAYVKWLNESQSAVLPKDFIFRLPTEAEWEKAARGTGAFEWPWGNEFDNVRCNSSEEGKGGTTPVGTYSPKGDSPYGCADMAGNVFEWTQSLMKNYPFNPKDWRENLGTLFSLVAGRVTRGGSFRSNKWAVRCALRLNWDARDFLKDIGFRLVVGPVLA